jgi:hydroxyacylglutathione hydrolase
MLQIKKYILGPFQNNTYLLTDPQIKKCVIIDPAIGSHLLMNEIVEQGLNLTQIWITHAHFDHVGGVHEIIRSDSDEIQIFIHPLEMQIWQEGGGSKEIGFELDLSPFPETHPLSDKMRLTIGTQIFQVLSTPGHTQGHVVFYYQEQNVAFCGDLIFKNSIGRTDLKGGDQKQIIKSIREMILTMPDETRLLCGHGPDTTVGMERKENPYL